MWSSSPHLREFVRLLARRLNPLTSGIQHFAPDSFSANAFCARVPATNDISMPSTIITKRPQLLLGSLFVLLGVVSFRSDALGQG
jgi:hypothetical protein